MKHFIYVMFCAMAFSAVSCAEKEFPDEKPLHTSGDSFVMMDKEDGVIRLVQYNVGAFRKSGGNSLTMIADMMKELNADVVSLNEVDSCTTRTGKINQLASFSYAMNGWGGYFARAMDHLEGGYGVAVSYNPTLTPLKTWSVKLPQGNDSEPRAMAVVEFEKFIFASTHLGLTDDSQMQQLNVINNWFASKYSSTSKPIFLCGDFNNTPSSNLIDEVKKTWKNASTTGAYTMPSNNPRKVIDYIFVRSSTPSVQIVKTAVPKEFESGTVTTASDHLPVYVDIKLL